MEKNSICIAVTLRAPLGQIKSFVNYHLNIGVDHIFLFFDSPNDKTIRFFKKNKRVSCFSGRGNGIVAIEDRQRKNANDALKIAREMNLEWIAHLDIDELILTRLKLKDLLGKVSAKVDYVRLATLESVPEKMSYKDPFKEITLFKNNFHKISKKYFKGHACGKSIVRTSARFDCIGIHRPSIVHGKLNSRYVLFNARLLHYFCCNYDDWKRKWIWRIDGSGRAKDMQPRENKYLEEFRKVYNQKDENKLREFYKKQYFISDIKKRLYTALGILLRIKLKENLFNSTKNDAL